MSITPQNNMTVHLESRWFVKEIGPEADALTFPEMSLLVNMNIFQSRFGLKDIKFHFYVDLE